MNNIYELGSSLQKLLSLLKKNRDHVPREILRTRYHDAYYQLLSQINEAARAFVTAILTDRLVINPNVSMEEQIAVINQTIQDSGLIKEMSHCMGTEYDAAILHRLALNLRKQVELALWPYINQETCLVADIDDLEKTPVIYNTLTRQVWENGAWVDKKINLEWKLLIYTKNRTHGGDLPEENIIPKI